MRIKNQELERKVRGLDFQRRGVACIDLDGSLK